MHNSCFTECCLLVLVSWLFIGCAAPRLNTASGNPEISIPDVTKKQVLDLIIAVKLQKGMQIKNVNDYGVVFTKKVDQSFLASFLYGSHYDSTPEGRLHYNVVEQNGYVKVYSRIEIVTNPDSAFESVSDITGNMGEQMQKELEGLKQAFEH